MIPVPDRIRRRYREVRDMVTPATNTCAVTGCGNTCAPWAEVRTGVHACSVKHMGQLLEPAPRTERTCEECGTPYTVPARLTGGRSKYVALCTSCLSVHL